MILPFLSFTATISTTSSVLASNLTASFAGCWASATQARNAARKRLISEEPHAQAGLHDTHRVRRDRKPELRTGDVGVPCRKDGMIEHVDRVQAEIETTFAEGARHGCVHGEGRRSGDRIAAGVPPLARIRRSKSSGIQMQARRRFIDRLARIVGTYASGKTCSSDGCDIDGSQRQSTARRHLSDKSPILEDSPAPAAQQRSAADSHARAVLHLQVEQVALIEIRSPAFAAEIEPVLCDQCPKRALSTEGGVIDGFGVGVLQSGAESVMQPAPQLDGAGVARRI